jgi:hypothetical protein
MWDGFCSAVEWLFGVLSLMIGLSLLATLPILQFLSLGYLLEVSGRVARSGRLRDGFIGVPVAARAGSVVLGTWLMLWPLRIVSNLWYASHLIDPGGPVTFRWRVALMVLTVLIVGHVIAAWYCGGRLRHFFWPLLAPPLLAAWILRWVISSELLRPIVRPVLGSVSPRLLADVTRMPPLTTWFPPAILWAGLRRGRMYVEARDAVWGFITRLQLPQYFWLGLRGFAGALAWLFVPILLIIGATTLPPGPAVLSALVGVPLLMLVLVPLPMLQAHFAAEKRMAAMFEIAEVVRMFFRAPIAFWCALFVTLLFALPLYLLKVELTAREVAWLPSLIFVVFIYPARLLSGWAVGRARRRQRPTHGFWNVSLSLLSTFAAVPVVAMYVFVLFLTRYTSWYGVWSLFEQHAFLLPVPFLNL